MAIVECQLTIQAAPEVVYRASQDYSVRYDWDPFPESMTFQGGATAIEKGTKVLVVAKSGLRMEVEFVQVAQPETAAIVMVRGPWFLESFGGSWIFKAEGEGATRARFRYSLKTRVWTFRPLSEWLATRYFKKIVIARLEALKDYCERTDATTGRTLGPLGD